MACVVERPMRFFAKAELFAEDEQGERHLVATGETLLVSLND